MDVVNGAVGPVQSQVADLRRQLLAMAQTLSMNLPGQSSPVQITPQLDARLAQLADLAGKGGNKNVSLTINLPAGGSTNQADLDAWGAEILKRVQKLLED